MERKILLGNEAMALGLLEAGSTLVASYPGTPASEIVGTLAAMKRAGTLSCHVEWSINEKVALEVALANSYAGRRSAVAMKQVGLNVAADPFLSAVYTGVKGGLVVIVADDPGPHSSQTEQDTRQFAVFAKAPVLDPADPEQARDWIALAFEVSEEYEIPVLFRPTTRVCHARQDMEIRPFPEASTAPSFEKEPTRWAATPKFRFLLHRKLNEKMAALRKDPRLQPKLLNEAAQARGASQTIVCSGVVTAYAAEILKDLGLWDEVPLYQVVMPFPLSEDFAARVLESSDRILVLEETQWVIESQFRNRSKVQGRLSGHVPLEGELLPETVERILREFLGRDPAPSSAAPASPGRRPTLCPGCGHRAAFFAIRKVFPKGIYPGDIGCYTLGLNLGAVDTVLCMGASISQAAGFYHAYQASGQESRPIVATIGDSTFYHAGIPALINAVVQGCRFVVVVLDNSTTAMTGHQPTPASGKTLDGRDVPRIRIEDVAKACGVRFVEVGDPYDFERFTEILKAAKNHTQDPDNGGMAVVIARRPCLMDRSRPRPARRPSPVVNENCQGCGYCIKFFECPALVFQEEEETVVIDETLCNGCGVCLHACPHDAIQWKTESDG